MKRIIEIPWMNFREHIVALAIIAIVAVFLITSIFSVYYFEITSFEQFGCVLSDKFWVEGWGCFKSNNHFICAALTCSEADIERLRQGLLG